MTASQIVTASFRVHSKWMVDFLNAESLLDALIKNATATIPQRLSIALGLGFVSILFERDLSLLLWARSRKFWKSFL